MNAVQGTCKGGQIVLDTPPAWREGVRVVIAPVEDSAGMTEDEQGDDPQSVARWIAEFEAIPPLQMTAAEEAAWQEARQA